MNKFHEIKTNLSEILSESTAYGFSKILKSKRLFFKIFWLAFILFGSIASIYFIFNAIQNYFKYEVIPKIEIIHENKISLPTITFCNNDKSFNKDLIDFCSFNKEQNNCIDNFQMFYSTWYEHSGNCLQFNSGKNSSIPILKTAGGVEYGLYISFKSNLSIDIWIDDPTSNSFINGKTYRTISDYLIDYEPQFYYDFQLSKTVENKLGPPYNPCYKENDLNSFQMNKTIINYLRLNNVKYKQEYCEQLCPELEYLKKNPCSCTNTSLGNVERDCMSQQLNQNIIKCTNDYLKNYDKKQLEETCKQYCPLECDSVTYTVSFMKDKDLTLPYILIYFKELKYNKYSEIPKTEPFDFISSIGGILGLFIGCSFVTLFEISELLFEICFIFYGKKQQQINNELSIEEKLNRLENELKQSQNVINSFEEQVQQLKAENKEIKASIKLVLKSKFIDT